MHPIKLQVAFVHTDLIVYADNTIKPGSVSATSNNVNLIIVLNCALYGILLMSTRGHMHENYLDMFDICKCSVNQWDGFICRQ